MQIDGLKGETEHAILTAKIRLDERSEKPPV